MSYIYRGRPPIDVTVTFFCSGDEWGLAEPPTPSIMTFIAVTQWQKDHLSKVSCCCCFCSASGSVVQVTLFYTLFTTGRVNLRYIRVRYLHMQYI